MKSEKIIIENDKISVYEGAIDYHGIGYIQNNTLDDVEVNFNDSNIIRIRLSNRGHHHKDWYVFKNTVMDRARLDAIKNGQYTLKTGEKLFPPERTNNSYL